MATPKKSREDLLAQIKKLLQMTTSNGCSEAEAANATSRVQSLMLKYNFSDLDIESLMASSEEDQQAHFNFEQKYHTVTRLWASLKYGYNLKLSKQLEVNFGVQFFSLARNQDMIVVVGSEMDCEVALQVYDFIFDQAYQSESTHWKTRDKERFFGYKRIRFYHEFLSGYMTTVCTNLMALHQETLRAAGCNAIVSFKSDALESYVGTQMRIIPGKPTTNQHSFGKAYEAGRKSGQSAALQLHKEIK